MKGGTLLFLAGQTASQPRPDADLGDFAAPFKAVFDKIGTTLAKAGGSVDRCDRGPADRCAAITFAGAVGALLCLAV